MNRCIVVMGVCGSGKSVVGQTLADRIGATFVEGDDWHPPANVQRMAAGIPLTDQDRHAWLDALAGRLREAQAHGEDVVLACSALKRRYRDRLRTGAPTLQLVHLHDDPAQLAQRLARRRGHYMPASLLPSQLEILEPPQADEATLSVDAGLRPDAIVAALCRQLQQKQETVR